MSPRPWRLMYRDTDPRSHESPRCLATFATKDAAERARQDAERPESVKSEHFHTWVEERATPSNVRHSARRRRRRR